MSFELRRNESVRKGVRRVVRKQLKTALVALAESSDHKRAHDVDECVHSVRKTFKRVRAVLRLVRDSIGDSTYRDENEAIRDAARPLSDLRDGKVLIEALEKLRDSKATTKPTKAAFTATRKILTERLKQLRKKVLDEGDGLAVAAAAVDEALKRADDWTSVVGGRRKLSKGVKRVYRSGRRAFDAAKCESSVENLHEWRKQVKYVRHDLELLTPAWPEVIGALAKEAEELGDLLGEDHDLAVLRSIVAENRRDPQLDAEALLELIDREREGLKSSAIARGELFFRERPAQFVERLRDYWKSWPADSPRRAVANC